MTAEPGNRSRRALPSVGLGLGGGVLGLGALAYIGVLDPHRPGSPFLPCPFKLITGLDCPGCGGLRMTYDLLHGDLSAAVTDNVYLLAGLPLLGLWWWWRGSRGRRVFTPAMLAVLIVSAVAWTVLRNLPGFPLVPTVFTGPPPGG